MQFASVDELQLLGQAAEVVVAVCTNDNQVLDPHTELARQVDAGLAGPPLAITALASSSGSRPQAPATHNPGRGLVCMKRSAMAKPQKPTASGASQSQPTSALAEARARPRMAKQVAR